VVHEFRSIERFLAQWNLEEEWEAIKDRAKFKCYGWNYNRLDIVGRKRFLPVMRKEFGEILNACPHDIFQKKDLRKMHTIKAHPQIYLLKTQFRDWLKAIFASKEK